MAGYHPIASRLPMLDPISLCLENHGVKTESDRDMPPDPASSSSTPTAISLMDGDFAGDVETLAPQPARCALPPHSSTHAMTQLQSGRLSAHDLAVQLANHRATVIDVRDPMEYASGHIAGSLNVPLPQLCKASLPQGPLVLVCQSGYRSGRGVAQLRRQRHSAPVSELEGGLPAWQQAGLPVRKLKGAPLPLLRQVQIAAGALVLAGLILSQVVAPVWILLTWFAGAGLVFAGVSGFCGMALLLRLMPWNQVRH